MSNTRLHEYVKAGVLLVLQYRNHMGGELI